MNVHRRDPRNLENRIRQNSSVSRHHQQVGLERFQLIQKFRRSDFDRLQGRDFVLRRDCADFARFHPEPAPARSIRTRDGGDDS